jgi:tRNA G18 (ribose-2'-O)-methylase SpoU
MIFAMIIGMRGYCGIGIMAGKTEQNVGTLWRSANLLEASFIFTIGGRYRRQCSDTMQTPRHIPLWEFEDFESFCHSRPAGCGLVGIELDERARPLEGFCHPPRAIYLLGAEDVGLPSEVLECCESIVQLPGRHSLNVAVAGSIVLYDRLSKS